MKKKRFSSRREFIKISGMSVAALFIHVPGRGMLKPHLKKITFGVCADVHKDIQPDADNRLRIFIHQAIKKKVDFIIQLGDFCFPKQKNSGFVKIWNEFNERKYHVLGNHDMDTCSKKEIMTFLDIRNSFYSFDTGDFHFVVLDLNFFKNEQGQVVPYQNGNYFSHANTRGTMPAGELDWLKKDIEKTNKHTIIFSHQSLVYSCPNGNDVRAVLEEANQTAGFKKIIACLNGHHHNNVYDVIGDIPYINVNSMSYKWLGNKYAYAKRYSADIMEIFPSAKYIAPYKDPLYAIVELTSEMMKITGTKSKFIPPSPAELGVPASANPDEMTPMISNRIINIV
ncbi:MAG: metallophosphoesterase [Bacteroidales bacterium]|nr:metallophosphoesterase [Bacteroidales bacterium]